VDDLTQATRKRVNEAIGNRASFLFLFPNGQRGPYCAIEGHTDGLLQPPPATVRDEEALATIGCLKQMAGVTKQMPIQTVDLHWTFVPDVLKGLSFPPVPLKMIVVTLVNQREALLLDFSRFDLGKMMDCRP
jgi:hypothetical protein